MNMQRLHENLGKLPTNYSTYAVLAILYAVDYWTGLGPDEKAAILAAYPWLTKLAMPAGFALFVVAKVWPQKPHVEAVDPNAPPAYTAAEVPMSRDQAIRTLLEAARTLAQTPPKKSP